MNPSVKITIIVGSFVIALFGLYHISNIDHSLRVMSGNTQVWEASIISK